MKLTSRQHRILWATVRSYIATAEPVGSKALASSYPLGVSTATIRNDLALLEQEGLLFQPHTSAGRIPSDSGYRIYVNELLDLESWVWGDPQTGLNHQDLLQRLAQHLHGQAEVDLESLLRRTARILANLSGCIAFVTAPQLEIVAIRHLQLVSLDPQRVMVILVTDSYQTHSMVVNLHEDGLPGVPMDELEQVLQLLSNFLTLKLRGQTLAQLKDLSWLELDREFRSYAQWLDQLFQVISQKYLKPSVGQVFTAGVTELMRQPEFAQTQQVQAVVQLLEGNDFSLGEVLTPNQPGQITIYIGTENPLQPIRHCTLIASTYYRGEDPAGSVSVLGPTRMVYERAITAVQSISEHLSQTLAQIA